jgi:hypothetical protein
MRERAPEKAGRLLATRRVHIVRVDGADVDAVVQGDTGTYVVERRLGRFACSCPAPVRAATVEPSTRSSIQPRRRSGRRPRRSSSTRW